jgi:anti-anti-sigma factor
MKAILTRGVRNIVFDMSEVSFMASAGWWVLIEIQKQSKRYNRGELALAKSRYCCIPGAFFVS